MKKKTIIICIIVAVAVFASSLTAALFIFNGKKDSDYSLSSDNTPDGKAVKSELNGCKTAEDYYNLARRYVDEHKIFYANEIIKTGYQKTKDKSLDIAVITGKPTLESAIIAHSVGDFSESVQYFLGRDTVISKPCYSGLSNYSNAFIYRFDGNTHRIKTIETGSILSYDKLDKDLRNIVIAGDLISRSMNSGTVYYDTNLKAAMREAEHHRIVSSRTAFELLYDKDDKLSKIKSGDSEMTITSTTTGYDVTIPVETKSVYNYYYSSSNSSSQMNTISIVMQQDNILHLVDDNLNTTEMFNYVNDGSYTLTLSGGKDSYSLSYDTNNLVTTFEYNGAKKAYSYNKNHLLSGIVQQSSNDSAMNNTSRADVSYMANLSGMSALSYNNKNSASFIMPMGQSRAIFGIVGNISYIDDLYMTNFLDHIFLSYDKENYITKAYTHDSQGNTTSMSLTYTENGKPDNCTLLSDKYRFVYDNADRISSFNYYQDDHADDAPVYDVIYDDEGIMTGISQKDADIWTLEGNQLYPNVGVIDESKVYITESADGVLSFSVRDATKEDYESYVQSYLDAGYTKLPLNRSNSSGTDGDSDTPCWLSKKEDSYAKIVRISWDPEAALYTVDIFNGSDERGLMKVESAYQQDING